MFGKLINCWWRTSIQYSRPNENTVAIIVCAIRVATAFETNVLSFYCINFSLVALSYRFNAIDALNRSVKGILTVLLVG